MHLSLFLGPLFCLSTYTSVQRVYHCSLLIFDLFVPPPPPPPSPSKRCKLPYCSHHCFVFPNSVQYLTVSVSTCVSVSAVRDFSLRYRVCKLPTSSMCLTNTRSLIVNLCYYFILLSKAYWFLVKRVGLLCHFLFQCPCDLGRFHSDLFVDNIVHNYACIYTYIYIITICSNRFIYMSML